MVQPLQPECMVGLFRVVGKLIQLPGLHPWQGGFYWYPELYPDLTVARPTDGARAGGLYLVSQARRLGY